MNGSRLSRRYRQRAKRRAKQAFTSRLSRHRLSRLELLEDRIVLNATSVAAGLDAGFSHPAATDSGADEWESASTLLVGTEEEARYEDTITSPDQGLLAYRSLLAGSTFSGNTGVSGDGEADAADEARRLLVKLRDQSSDHASKVLGTWTRPPGERFVGPRTLLQNSMELVQARSSARVFPNINAADASFSTVSSTSDSSRSPSLEPRAADASSPDLARWYQVDIPAGVDVDAAVAQFASMAEIEYAEPNVEWQVSDEIPPIIEGLPDATTDPAYDEQWFHTNAKIPNTWNHLNHNGVYPGGSQDVVVAVIDSGVDYTHEELAASMWTNPGEIPNNGIDDDGNGFVDDVYGANVVSNPQYHSGDPMDLHGHGTHVAGIIAAQGFNEVGGVGVAFNTKIMAVRAAQYSGTLTVQDIAEGIQYAVDNGADVINMSFGGYQHSQIVQDALEVALNQAVLVAAAGNDSLAIHEAPFYPAAIPWVLGTVAMTPENTHAWFTNTGYEVRAPGVGIHSTLPGDRYAAWSGTSMAAPV
ncbi:MAG: S8 family peptidase, partial [Pirellulaceae bacterium]